MHLRIQNTNERDPLSYAAIKAVSKIAQKKYQVSEFERKTHYFRDIAAMLYQLSSGRSVFTGRTLIYMCLSSQKIWEEKWILEY